MRLKPIALALAIVGSPALAADDTKALMTELKRLSERIEALEKQNKEMEKALTTERISEKEPEVVTRLKAVEFQTLSMQKQARQIEALDGVSVGASITSVAQKVVGSGGAASGNKDSRVNYRGDISVTLPGGEMGNTEGKIFAHFRFGQGTGVGLRPTYTSGANTTAFQVAGNANNPTPPDDSFAILAQAWYQLKIPLMDGGLKANAREHLHFTFGKIDPFVFFDQNAAADDESTKFMNNAFVHNPLLDSGRNIGADAYGFTPGAIFQYVNEKQKGSEWLLSLGAFATSGANATANGANFNGSFGAPLVIAQAETAARFNFLPGNYRAYLWSNGRGVGYDGQQRPHTGIGFSADQKVDDYVTLFGRYGHQLKGQVRFDRALTLGGELGGSLWGRGADAIGVAFGTLRTSGGFTSDSLRVDANADGTADFGYTAKGWEKQNEVYYRFRVNNRFELSPNFQLISNAGGNNAAPTIKVVGLRAKIGF